MTFLDPFTPMKQIYLCIFVNPFIYLGKGCLSQYVSILQFSEKTVISQKYKATASKARSTLKTLHIVERHVKIREITLF